MKSSPFEQPRSLFDVWSLYQADVAQTQTQQKASTTLSLVRRSLIRYTLPGWGLSSPKQDRLNAWETYQGLNMMKKITLKQLSTAAQVQQQVFEDQQVPTRTRQTYQSALNRFLRWCEMQAWWVPTRTSRQTPNVGKHSTEATQLKQQRINATRKQRYGLGAVSGDVVPERLLEELKVFRAFRLEQTRTRQSTIDRNLRQIRLLLGWLYRVKGIPLDQLSLEAIVPFVDLDIAASSSQVEMTEQSAFETRDLAKQYIDWLQLNSAGNVNQEPVPQRSAHSSVDVLGIFLVVAQFVYRDRLQGESSLMVGKRYQDVPVIQLLRKELADVQSQVKQHQGSLSDRLNKLPAWAEVLRFVEELRQACATEQIPSHPTKPRKEKSANARALEVCAQRYQRFLLAAFLSYLPPQRQQVYRNLRISAPDNLTQEKIKTTNLEQSGYLYQELNQWYLHLYDDEYKTSKSYQEISIALPNIQYKDGRCFYHYLEEWLFKYEYTTSTSTEAVDGLRQVFKPEHDYFFTQRNGKRYNHATNFSRLLHSSFEGSDAEFTPELIRKVFAAHVSKQEHIVQKVQALLEQKGQWFNSEEEQYDLWRDQGTVQLGSELAREEAEMFVQQSSPGLNRTPGST